MRKKSHVSLAKYIVRSEGMEDLWAHRGSLYLGSVLPDCTPVFLTRKHSMEESFHILEKELRRLDKKFDPKKGFNRYFCRHLGIITHYVSDYFTFPHNSNYSGNLKEHCLYEKELKHRLREYVKSDEAVQVRKENMRFKSTEEILLFIRQMHGQYMQQMSVVKRDIQYIVSLCFQVVDAILQFFENRRGNGIQICYL